VWSSLGQASPVIFMSMVYQNIVPSVVKLLDYDMKKIASALSLGSFLPLCLYLAWCVVGSSSGNVADLPAGPLLLGAFTASTLVGSAIGTGMSLVEEVQSLRSTESSAAVNDNGEEPSDLDLVDSPPTPLPEWGSVAVSFGLPLVAALALGQSHVVEALEWAGSFGSPLLYGVLPAAMAFQQRQRRGERQLPLTDAPWKLPLLEKDTSRRIGSAGPVPSDAPPFVYSLPSLGVLGLISSGFIAQELVQQVSALSS
jgi:tyrosine-specific transport protein